jgi:hypothetical protein
MMHAEKAEEEEANSTSQLEVKVLVQGSGRDGAWPIAASEATDSESHQVLRTLLV